MCWEFYKSQCTFNTGESVTSYHDNDDAESTPFFIFSNSAM